MASSAPNATVDLNAYVPRTVSHNLTYFDATLSMDLLNNESQALKVGIIPTGMDKTPSFVSDRLVSIDGKGKYSDPKFEWQLAVGVTALKFYNSDKLGNGYKDDMFVGDINNGRIYHFELNENRTQLSFNTTLPGKVNLEDLVFAEGFGGISDIKVSPDGYLYVVSYSDGTIYRVLQK